jgi:predicted nucleotidyltransferase
MQGVDQLIQRTRLFVERQLEPWPEFLAAFVIGSVATGEARANSDVDCLFVFERLDERIVPAEFVWHPESDAISTIFEVEADQSGAVQIDSKRVELAAFLDDEWEDGLKHELSQALVLFDREGSVQPRITAKLRYSDELQAERLLQLVARIEHSLASRRLEAWIKRGGLVGAHEQLTAAFEDVLQLLHAANRVWLPWRTRWLVSARKLPWLPDAFATCVEQASGTGALTDTDLWRRHTALLQLYRDIQKKLREAGNNVDPEDTFARLHPGLGYAYNMDAWKVAHRELIRERASSLS